MAVVGAVFQVRAVDATTVKEPGPSGSLWRLHYSVGLPSDVRLLQADGNRGAGHGRIVGAVPDPRRRPCAGRPRLFDRAGHSPRGRRGGRLIVRVNTRCRRRADGRSTCWPPCRRSRVRAVSSWATMVASDDRGPACEVAGRVCGCASPPKPSAWRTRKSAGTLPARATRCNRRPCGSPSTDRLHEPELPGRAGVVSPALAGELGFKRFKSLAWGTCRRTTAPRRGATALFVALLVEKLIHHARAISPWGYDVPAPAPPKPVA